MNSSLLQSANGGLVSIAIKDISPHPLNSNQMSAELLDSLKTNIDRTNNYPPIIVRPIDVDIGKYETLDGHNRLTVLDELGFLRATCYVWPCSDEEALVLLATLNRLEGEDVPSRRVVLLKEIHELIPDLDLASVLPENKAMIEELLALTDIDEARLWDELESAFSNTGSGPVHISFAINREDESLVEQAVSLAQEGLTGTNRRGGALAAICRRYKEVIREGDD